MKRYNRIVTEIKDAESYLLEKRSELAICIIGYIRRVLNTELTIDDTTKTIRDFLTDLSVDLEDILGFLSGDKAKNLLFNLDTVGLASLMNDESLVEVVKELQASSSHNIDDLDL